MNKTAVFDMLFQDGLEKGLQQGIEKGIEKGEEKGRKETARCSVLRILLRRFGPGAENLRARIEAIDDPARLEALVEEAAVVPSLEAFTSILDGLTG